MLKRIVLAATLACSGSHIAEGQRLVRTLRPPERSEGAELKFDTNLQPLTKLSLGLGSSLSDANYAPKLIFLPDSSRVFAVFPGSDRLVGWDVESGEVVADLEIPGNPASVTRSPNGVQIGVVSLFIEENFGAASNNFEGARIGAISIVDLETLEIRTLSLTEVFFSFFNNLVFTSDGTRAFVASAATDELLQIDITTMTETGPRIKFDGGTRPTPVSISPDSSLLAVTLIGSPLLPRDEIPDSVQIIDTESFTKAGSIVPAASLEVPIMGGQTQTVVIQHDFVATNNLAFSPNGRWAIIAEQASSSASSLPEHINDRVFFIDMETREVDEVFETGGVAGTSVLLPDSEVFCVISAVDLTFIDYDSRDSWKTQDPRSQFRVSSRPGFRGDQVFIGSPVRDAVVRFNVNSGELRSIVAVSPEFEPESLIIPAGPLDISVSPDGRTIAALVFNDNSVDLFQPTKRFTIPQFTHDSTWLTGIALTNVSGVEVEVVGLAYNNVGAPVVDIDECADPENEDEDCENVLEVVNPQTFNMQPEEQLSFTPLGFLDAVAGTTVDGWLDLDVNAENFSGLFLSLDQQVTRMDGGSLGAAGARAQVLSHFRVQDPYVAELVIINSSLSLSDVNVGLVDSDGLLVQTVNIPIAPAGRISRPIRDFAIGSNGIFNSVDFEEGKSHFLLLNSDEELISFVRYYNDSTMAVLEGTHLGQTAPLFVDYQIAPQVIAFGGNSSTLTAINLNPEEAKVTLTLHPRDSDLQVDPVEAVLPSMGLLKQELADLFSLEDDGEIVSGWVELTSDRGGIVGSVEFQLFDGKAMSTLPFFPEGNRRILFSHVAQGSGFVTGLIALNPGEGTATVDLVLRVEGGSEVATAQLVLLPGERRALLVEELFGRPIEQIGGRIDLEADLPVIGVEMFFSENGEILSAVPGNVLPD